MSTSFGVIFFCLDPSVLGKSWKTVVLVGTSTVTGSFPGSGGSPQEANNTALQQHCRSQHCCAICYTRLLLAWLSPYLRFRHKAEYKGKENLGVLHRIGWLPCSGPRIQ